MAESSDEKPNTPLPSSSHNDFSQYSKSKSSAKTTLWIDYAAEQAQLAQKIVEETVDSAIAITHYRVHRFLSTGSAHLHQTIDSLKDLNYKYDVYEHIVFGKIKEYLLVSASHPVASCSDAVFLGFLTLKRPRRFLCYNTLRLFTSEESLLSRADNKVKELRQSIDLLKAESEKLEVSNLASEAKKERSALTKEVSKIINYGISV